MHKWIGALFLATLMMTSPTQVILAAPLNPGDLTGDFYVNIEDVVLVINHYGQTGADSTWDSRADTNDDGVINAFDLSNVTTNFGKFYEVPTVSQKLVSTFTNVLTRRISVRAIDDDNPAGGDILIYTWSATSSTGGSVLFTPNGSTAARDTSAVFSAIGSYDVKVSISDAGGNAVTAGERFCPQTISFDPLPDVLLPAPPIQLSALSTRQPLAQGSPSVPASFRLISGPATLQANTLTLQSIEGQVTVEAYQDGTDISFAATPVRRTFTALAPIKITVTTPAPNAVFSSSSVVVSGVLTIRASTLDELRINSVLVTPDASFNFSKTLSLASGANQIVIKALSASGITSSVMIPVTVNLQPNITILSPADNTVFNVPFARVVIQGDGMVTSVSVNNKLCSKTGNLFYCWANLSAGQNTLTATTALDTFGRRGSDTVPVTFTPPAGWSPTADSDADGYTNNNDLFPNNPQEWADDDNDGVGNNGDSSPSDPSKSVAIAVSTPENGFIFHAR